MPSALATAGYHGPPELTVSTAFSQWVLDPWALAAILVLAAVYLTGVAQVRRAGQHWPTGRVIAFCGFGLGFGVIATMSFLGAYQNILFYARAAQTTLLLLVVPMFFALGKPISLAIAAAPRAGAKIEAAIASRTAKILTFPAITTLVLVVMPFLVYFTSWYEAGLHSTLAREFTHLALMAPGFVFFWTLLRVDPVPISYPYVVALWITGAEVIGDAILGLAIVADPNMIAAAYYHALARPWGPTIATDQVLGGGTLWVLGDIVGLPFLVAQLIQMIREDEADAKVIDAELDAAAAAEATLHAETAVAAGGQPGPAQRPWWESDPRFADRFAPVEDSGARPASPGPAGS